MAGADNGCYALCIGTKPCRVCVRTTKLCGTFDSHNIVSISLWNYNPDNDDVAGDYWNGENFSWFSSSRARVPPTTDGAQRQTDSSLDQGGRLLSVIVRPYPAKVAGIPTFFSYNVDSGSFVLRYTNPAPGAPRPTSPSVCSPPIHDHPHIQARETEIFVPSALAHGRRMIVEYGNGETHGSTVKYEYDEERQTLFLVHQDGTTPGRVHQVKVTFDPPVGGNLSGGSTVRWEWVVALLMVWLAMGVYWARLA